MYRDQLDNLKRFYSTYSESDLNLLAQIYDSEIVFKDVVHKIEGYDALYRYFEHGRSGLKSCRFDFNSELVSGHTAVLEWTMAFEHPRLKKGVISVDGCSILVFSEVTKLVKSHTDYFDAGAMIYENVPVVGAAVRFIKQRLSGEV